MMNVDRDYILQNCMVRLINPKAAANCTVHREYLNLIEELYFPYEQRSIGKPTLFFLERLGINDLPNLFDIAEKNTSRIKQYKAVSLDDILNISFTISKLIAITSEDHTLGAAALTDLDFLKNVSDKFEDDLIIFPSSIHELIVAPNSNFEGDMQGLVDMVTTINQSAVEPVDRLTNSVYLFDREDMRITYMEGDPI